MNGGGQRLDDEARRSLNGDRQLCGRREALQPRGQLCRAGSVMRRLEAGNDAAHVVEDADGVFGRAPSTPAKMGMGESSGFGVDSPEPEDRSDRSLTGASAGRLWRDTR